MKDNMTFKKYRGKEGLQILTELANLRIQVFREYPYLYEGDIQYEQKYLGRYFASPNSFVFTVRDKNEKLIGVTTAILLADEDISIQSAFHNSSLGSPEQIVYFGESLVLKEFRGQGIGEIFFKEREAFGLSFPRVYYATFCAVDRSNKEFVAPDDYRSPESLWRRMGYEPAIGIKTKMEWKDIGQVNPTQKNMKFWIKNIRN